MKRDQSGVEADNPLLRFVDQFGSELCWFSFLITGDWDLSIEAVVGVLDLECLAGQSSCAGDIRRLVAAASVSSIDPDLRESARRSAWAAKADPAALGWRLDRRLTGCSVPTRARIERALLAIDVFPRCALLLTVFEEMSIEDTVFLLRVDEGLVRGARNLGLFELAHNIGLGDGRWSGDLTRC